MTGLIVNRTDELTLQQKKQLLQKYQRNCLKCGCNKPPRAHHCSICGRCVLGMDHHCPWMNNCIGLRNQKSFLLFNFYTSISGLYTSIRAIVAIVFCFQDDSKCYTYNTALWKGVGIGAIFICLLFVVFTSVMLTDQVKMKYEETSTIDKMQLEKLKQ